MSTRIICHSALALLSCMLLYACNSLPTETKEKITLTPLDKKSDTDTMEVSTSLPLMNQRKESLYKIEDHSSMLEVKSICPDSILAPEYKIIPLETTEECVVGEVSNLFVGDYSYSAEYINGMLKEFNERIPVGFRCRNASYGYYEDHGTQYWLLGLVVVIIFVMCSILFESLRLPLAIISLIPVSFVGTFLTYLVTGVKFGTGGFASMVLLCGLTVNAGIYIVCEYRNQRSAFPRVSPLKSYMRAYNHKVTAVFLTVLSTILGLVPFLIDGGDEPFWFSFAVGSTGGLLFSLIALLLAMPAFMKLTVRKKK